ncbi:unnamed protein product [Diamesa serratosioi]
MFVYLFNMFSELLNGDDPLIVFDDPLYNLHSPMKNEKVESNVFLEVKVENITPELFYCAVCTIELNTEVDYLQHQFFYHSLDSFPTINESSNQISTVPLDYECFYCGIKMNKLLKLKAHIHAKHIQNQPLSIEYPSNPTEVKCIVCGQIVLHTWSLNEHIKIKHKNLLNIKSDSDLDINQIKSKLQALERAGKWTEPIFRPPITPKWKFYRRMPLENDDSTDSDEYYRDYTGSNENDENVIHDDSDEYQIMDYNVKPSQRCSNGKKRRRMKRI